MEGATGNILAIRASGKLTDADYKDTWVPKMKELLEAYDSLRILLVLEDFDGLEAGAMWDDARMGFSHLGDMFQGKFEKIAIVGGNVWYRRFGEAFGFLMPGKVEGFEAADLDGAWSWIRS
jgi:hypothetical protein